MKPLYIFDLDGTLALIEHRRHFIDRERGKQDWTAFYAACDRDEPNTAVLRVFNDLAFANELWIFSGRSDEVRPQTVAWLAHHTVLSTPSIEEKLMMRRAGDYTPDDELKLDWLRGMLVDDRQRLVAVFEDRDRMVKMWRAEGVACFQVAPGDF
jgi:hypothetical protein